ncbi:hypothetical protein [Streptomyces mirabilis]|uniref:Uncharacterized ACR, COG1993 n=1 Tax=Streptomyces mirabilis TaxID=68239 RepID=A0A1I2J5I7_9ACTN|nr:hypothetical protein [Streptomyces mirabilis]SFF49804.1 Uncharacterized ACR, COG1993 [Streptomyces mirabilis]
MRRKESCGGASVRCGIAGFGDGGTVRRESVLPVVQHLPASTTWSSCKAFVTRLDRMQGVLLATLQPVEVVDNPAEADRDSQAW